MVSLEKQRAVDGLNPPTASIRVSRDYPSSALHRDTVVSGPPNVPSALVPFLQMIIVIRNGQILSRDMTLLRAGVEHKVMLRCTNYYVD